MTENSDALTKLKTLPVSHQLAFAASCCERLVPNYHAFSITTGWGKPALVDHALEQVWVCCTAQGMTIADAKELLSQCEWAAPDSKEFGTIYTQLAIDAIGAIWCLLDFRIGGDFELVVTVSKLAVASAEYYVMAANWPSATAVTTETAKTLDEWIRNAPLVRAELDKQARDIAALLTQDNLSDDFIMMFRHAANETGIHPVRRGLIIDPRKQ